MESILWTIKQNVSHRAILKPPEVPAKPLILKEDSNISKTPSQSDSSLSVKFLGEEDDHDPAVKLKISQKIKSLTASLNKMAKLSTTSRANTHQVEDLLKLREKELRTEFEEHLVKEIDDLKMRFDEVLRNEQIRTTYMLTGAHRERKEKIKALKTQLECKNLAGLMYVMCIERNKCKMQKMKIIEDYTKYINGLHALLRDSQEVILNLSRGYKTAARVDREWRDKVMAVINEFRAFVYNFVGGTPETNQYFFNIPELMRIEASTKDNPEEDPCECQEVKEPKEPEPVREWWDRMNDDCDPPFVVFGDMETFTYHEKAAIKKATKAKKTAPERWKEYAFNHAPILAECPQLDKIKDQYLDRIPLDKWDCHVHSDTEVSLPSVFNPNSRRVTTQSIDYRNMGSILKIITATAQNQFNKTMLLGAKDSMEIASTTKLRRKSAAVSSDVKVFEDPPQKHENVYSDMTCDCVSKAKSQEPAAPFKSQRISDPIEADMSQKEMSGSGLGSIHNDSLNMIHSPDKDRTINYEKVCPMPACQLEVDSFIRALPVYMKANPFTHFEVNFDAYETCSPEVPGQVLNLCYAKAFHPIEQLEVLRERIEAKRLGSVSSPDDEYSEWGAEVAGVACQTSDLDLDLDPGLPPCTCRDLPPEPAVLGCVYNVENLLPLKKALDEIKATAFYDPTIQFNRFEIIGEPSDSGLDDKHKIHKDFKTERVDKIVKILRKHPSLGDLFQANHRC